jgi:glycerol kinase
MQFTADITGVDLSVSEVAESSAWGAVMNGLLGLGVYSSPLEFAKLVRREKTFRPRMKVAEAKNLHAGWVAAVNRVL